MLCCISTSLIDAQLWAPKFNCGVGGWRALRRGGTMAAYASVDVPGPLLPQLGCLLAEFEKDGRGKDVAFWHFCSFA